MATITTTAQEANPLPLVRTRIQITPLLQKDRAKIDWIHLVPFINFDWTFHKGGAVVIKIDENDEQVTTRVDISLPLSMRNRVIPLINEKKEQEARRRKKATKGPLTDIMGRLRL